MPGPLTLWIATLVLAAMGAHRRRAGQVEHRGDTVIRLMSVVQRLPVVAVIAEYAATPGLTANLVAAGMSDVPVRHVARCRAVGAQLGAVVAVCIAPVAPPATILGILVGVWGYLMPAVWIAGAARNRRNRIVADLPDVIDVVVLCTEAGMALEPALRLASDRLPGPCSAEIGVSLAQMDLGTARRDAYRGLAERIDTPEIRGLIGALLQADELGAPINDALDRQADLLRAGRRQAIRDAAARTAPKVQLVVAMVMVPGALLVVVGVMVLQLIGQLGAVTGGMP